jgi:hypothetical protein
MAGDVSLFCDAAAAAVDGRLYSEKVCIRLKFILRTARATEKEQNRTKT